MPRSAPGSAKSVFNSKLWFSAKPFTLSVIGTTENSPSLNEKERIGVLETEGDQSGLENHSFHTRGYDLGQHVFSRLCGSTGNERERLSIAFLSVNINLEVNGQRCYIHVPSFRGRQSEADRMPAWTG